MSLLHVVIILLGFSSVCYLLLGIRLFADNQESGSRKMAPLFFLISIWVASGAVELSASSFAVFTLGRVGHYIGTAFTPLVAFVYFRHYTGQSTRPILIALLAIVPLISVVLAGTNHLHELMWHLPIVDAAGHFLTRPVEFGTWFKWVHAPYSYSLVTVSIFSLVTKSSAATPAHRKSFFLLAGACSIPLVTSIAYNTGIGPATMSIVPIVFAVTLPLYAWLFVSEHMVDFSPVAYETVFQHMQDPVIVLDDQQRVIGLNHGAESLLSISEAAALKKTLSLLFASDMPEIQKALDTGQPQKLMTNTGRFLHVQASSISGKGGSINSGRVLMFRDVSDVEKAQKEIRSSEILLRTLVDHSADGILRLRWGVKNGGNALNCIFANTAAGRFLHMNPADLIGWSGEDLIAEFSSGTDVVTRKNMIEQFKRAATAGEVFETEFCFEINNDRRCLQLICEPVDIDVAVTLVDVTDRKAKEEQMESIALSDPLTGVLNRRGFEDQSTRRLAASDDLAEGALLFIDLNDFKLINDKFGHEAGDELLKHVAARLKKRLRPSDIIARPGGDEFVALVPDVSEEVVGTLAERLAESLAEPYRIVGEDMTCTASIGLALYPKNANTLTGLMRSADAAMYRAKARCRNSATAASVALLEKAS